MSSGGSVSRGKEGEEAGRMCNSNENEAKGRAELCLGAGGWLKDPSLRDQGLHRSVSSMSGVCEECE